MSFQTEILELFMEASFTVKTKEFKNSLARIKRFNTRYFKEGSVKVRTMPGGIELSTIGFFETIHGETNGLAEVLAPLKLLLAFVNDSKHEKITFKFRKGEVQCGNSVFSYPHIKVETWYNSPDTRLSIHPTDIELLKMGYRDINEILKYDLYTDYMKAKNKLNKSISEAFGSLKYYNINKEDIEILLRNKLLK